MNIIIRDISVYFVHDIQARVSIWYAVWSDHSAQVHQHVKHKV
jgi:hypothetical protein